MKDGQWTVERHGGGLNHGWRKAFTGNEKPARNQLFLTSTMMAQGGVRLINPAGVILSGCWRIRGGTILRQVKFCIGCGCHDCNACITKGRGYLAACHWLEQDRKTATGVCSYCPRALKRWAKGDRRVRGRRA